MKTPERKNTRKRRSGIFIINFEHLSHFFLVFLLLALNKQMLAGNAQDSSRARGYGLNSQIHKCDSKNVQVKGRL